jgi:hypothetical protein
VDFQLVLADFGVFPYGKLIQCVSRLSKAEAAQIPNVFSPIARQQLLAIIVGCSLEMWLLYVCVASMKAQY